MWGSGGGGGGSKHMISRSLSVQVCTGADVRVLMMVLQSIVVQFLNFIAIPVEIKIGVINNTVTHSEPYATRIQ